MEWDQKAVKIVIENIQSEIKKLEIFKCFHCKDYPINNNNNNNNNEICNRCRLNRDYEIIKCNERLSLWKSRLREE